MVVHSSRERACACMCASVRACMCACVCACVRVWVKRGGASRLEGKDAVQARVGGCIWRPAVGPKIAGLGAT